MNCLEKAVLDHVGPNTIGHWLCYLSEKTWNEYSFQHLGPLSSCKYRLHNGVFRPGYEILLMSRNLVFKRNGSSCLMRMVTCHG